MNIKLIIPFMQMTQYNAYARKKEICTICYSKLTNVPGENTIINNTQFFSNFYHFIFFEDMC